MTTKRKPQHVRNKTSYTIAELISVYNASKAIYRTNLNRLGSGLKLMQKTAL